MFEGFELSTIDCGEAMIHVRQGGSGPPLLLLHGHPQTHAMWHAVRLGFERFSVACHDRRGRVACRLALDHPRQQRLIGADPDAYYFRGDRARFHPEALEETTAELVAFFRR